jgi:hypothetical protein
MSTHRLLLAAALSLAMVPSALAACDLDGLPGFHRANPFGTSAPMFRSVPLQRPAPEPERVPNKATEAKPSSQSSAPTAQQPPAQGWNDRENPGPISAEDKASFF